MKNPRRITPLIGIATLLIASAAQADWTPVGPAGSAQDAGPGTDFHAVENGLVSVTPLEVDLTAHGLADAARQWLTD
jgi:broad specificity polyphosphatase/5'/3'-nucleotidase SurE